MYLISVVVGRTNPLVWALLFKNEQNAQAALGRLREVGDIDVQDEHGQRLCAKGGDLGPIMFENMDESKIAMIERTMHEQRVRSMIQQRMRAEPSLQPVGGGPAMLSPLGMNGRG